MSYEDIMKLSRPVSAKHPPMPREERAAQFSPFAALTGYEEAIAETGRLTERRLTLTEEEKAQIDSRLNELDADKEASFTLTYFVKDRTKEGGEYVTVPAKLRKLDRYTSTVYLDNGLRIAVEDIFSISR